MPGVCILDITGAILTVAAYPRLPPERVGYAHNVSRADQEHPTARVPSRGGLPALRRAAASCRACELWRTGTQTVFGEGPSGARILLAGEQPGDAEDRQGRPFVGPAGRVLDEALAAIDLDRRQVFVTNVVKHFRWELQRGKKRIHRKPGLAHVRACEPWLREELRVVDPEVVVLLGATAAQAVLGPGARVTELRGRPVSSKLDAVVVVTIHPSSILRTRDRDAKHEAFEAFVEDLRVAVHAMS